MKKILLYIGCALMVVLSSCTKPNEEDLSAPVVVVMDTIGGHPCIRYEHDKYGLSMSWATLNAGADSLVAPGVRIPWGENDTQLKEHMQKQGSKIYYDFTDYCYHLMDLSAGLKIDSVPYDSVLVRYFGADSLTLVQVDSMGIGAWLRMLQDSMGIDSTARMDSIKMYAYEPYNHYFNRYLKKYVCHDLYDWWYPDSLVRKAIDGLSELLPADDYATLKWGAAWQMPTAAHWRELYANCVWEWVDETPVNSPVDWEVTYKVGYKVMAKTPMIQLNDTIVPRDSMYIFLPVTGFCSGGSWHRQEVFFNELAEGYYWSKSLFPENDAMAQAMAFSEYSHMVISTYRNLGLAIRPVTKQKTKKE